MSQEIKPLVSDEQIEWHSRHDANGELVSIETMSPWSCRDLYEADRAASRLLIEKLRDAISDNNGVLISAANPDAYEQRDAQVNDNNALIAEANAFLKH